MIQLKILQTQHISDATFGYTYGGLGDSSGGHAIKYDLTR